MPSLPFLHRIKRFFGKSDPVAEPSQKSSFELAQEVFKNKDFSRASKLLQTHLEEQSDDAEAHRLLAASLANEGQFETALQHADTAIALKSDGVIFHMTRAHILRFLGRTEDAEAAYRQQIHIDPKEAAGHYALGEFLLHVRKQTKDARTAFEECIRLDPEHTDARLALASIHFDDEAYDQALIQANEIIKLTPESVPALVAAGRAQSARLHFAEADMLFRTALSLDPDCVEAMTSMAHNFQMVARGSEAEACLRLAHGIEPKNRDIAKQLVSQLIETQQFNEASDLTAAFLADYPDDPDLILFSARIAVAQLDSQLAFKLYDELLQRAPEDLAIRLYFANTKAKFGAQEEALKLGRQLLQTHPDDIFVQYNIAYIVLLAGSFREGLKLFESRLETAYAPRTPYDLRAIFYPLLEAVKHIPKWMPGTSIAGKHLLIWREQGLGDVLMMLRFLIDLRALKPAKLTVYVDDPILPLVKSMGVADKVMSQKDWEAEGFREDPEIFDLQCSIASLPWMLGSELNDVGKNVPYILPPDEASRPWLAPLWALPHPRIGLVWAGNPALSDDKLRSLSIAALAPVLDVKNINFVSLQKGEARSQLNAQKIPVLDLMDNCSSFEDTAAIIANLDLVISVDTSVAHLAGAMGKPVWLFNRASSEWRWMWHREDSPWYPSMRLFNQMPDESWSPVIQRLANALQSFSEHTTHCT